MSDKNKGSVLVLIVIIIAIVSSISLMTLSIATSQYQIKKTNSNIKRALYLSEDGINNTAMRVYNMVCSACNDSVSKVDEYIEAYPEDVDGAEALFRSSYKSYVINRAAGTVKSSKNPATELENYDKLFFKGEKLTLCIKSTYVSTDGIKKSVSAEMHLLIPRYADIKTGRTDPSELFELSSIDL